MYHYISLRVCTRLSYLRNAVTNLSAEIFNTEAKERGKYVIDCWHASSQNIDHFAAEVTATE
jgi:hypothetical protein